MKAGRAPILLALLGVLLGVWLTAGQAQPPASLKVLPEILEFDRKLCPVCKEAELIIRAVQYRYPGQLAVRKVYIDEEPQLFHRYNVAIVPTQVFLDRQGREVFRHEGVFPQDQLVLKLRELKFLREGD